MQLDVVVFSKDRPFQLRESLRSLGVAAGRAQDGCELMSQVDGTSCFPPLSGECPAETTGPKDDAKDARHLSVIVTVICNCSTIHIREAYEKVEVAFTQPHSARTGALPVLNAHVKFIYEGPESCCHPSGCSSTSDASNSLGAPLSDTALIGSAAGGNDAELETGKSTFSNLLQRSCLPTPASASQYTMLMVDDTLWLNPPDLHHAVDVLSRHDDVLAYHWKLHPGICMSHPAGSVCEPPSFLTCGSDSKAWQTSLRWKYEDGTVDWAYAWDLCATVYRTTDLQEMLRGLISTNPKALSHPNLLEVGLNEAWAASHLKARRAYGACPVEPQVVVVTVNRVQEHFQTPVFQHAIFDADVASQCALAGDFSVTLDESASRRQHETAAHVGHWQLRSGEERGEEWGGDGILVSVLLPAYNCAKYVKEAIDSIVNQTWSNWELVIVNDGSTDVTPTCLENIYTALPPELQRKVTIIHLPTNGGIANALNAGLRACKGGYIARMDADDVSHPNRLRRQVEFMEGNKHISGVGSAVEIIDDGSNSTGKVLALPTHELLLLWDSLFFCPLAHPAVMLRADAFRVGITSEAGLYSSETTPADDYDLWLKCLWRKEAPLIFSNLGVPLLKLRKHATNISAVQAARQQSKHVSLLQRTYNLVCGRTDVSIKAAEILSKGSACDFREACTVADVAMAFMILQQLHLHVSSMCTLLPCPPGREWEAFAAREFFFRNAASRSCEIVAALYATAPVLAAECQASGAVKILQALLTPPPWMSSAGKKALLSMRNHAAVRLFVTQLPSASRASAAIAMFLK